MSICKSILASVLVLAACLALAGPAAAKPSEDPFEFIPGSFQIAASTDEAAAHEDLTTSFNLAQEESGKAAGQTHNDVRTVTVNLPPGFIGNDTAVPTCTFGQLVAIAGAQNNLAQCPIASQVGMISFEVTNPAIGAAAAHFTVPLYNMEVTSFGIAAEFGFKSASLTQVLQVTVRPGDSGLTITTPNIAKVEPHNISVTVWGLPAAHEHDVQRGEVCGGDFEVPPVCRDELGGPQEAHIPIKPFLANPTSCESHVASIEADSWEHPFEFAKSEAEIGPIDDCEQVPFDPSIEVQPTTRAAESPSGLNISLVVPQTWENPYTLATSDLKNTTLALPVGYTANPSLAAGLGVCSVAQFESETSSSAPGAGCPAESKIGTVEVETPVLAEKLTGNIYIATPFANKFGSLLGLYIVVKDPERGIIVKLAGQITPNETTGQLVTTFDDNPQVPFSRFTLKLRQGATSPLVSPPTCGSYTARAAFTPWSAPSTAVPLASSFQIEDGIGGAVPLRRHPSLQSRPSRRHRKQRGRLLQSAQHPHRPQRRRTGDNRLLLSTSPRFDRESLGRPVLLRSRHRLGADKERRRRGMGSSVPCRERNRTDARQRWGGVRTCGDARESVYGWSVRRSPFSIAAITSAKVGPFDLGTVVVHLPLFIDPETAAVSIPAGAADQIPHIIKGIVIHVREIRVSIDRKDFSLNPTNCNQQTFAATVIGGGADPADLLDNDPVTVNSPFRVTACQALQFKPTFSVSTSSKTSRADGASLTAKLTYPAVPAGAQANISKVKVDLPRQLPSRLTTLQKACPSATFDANPAMCPAASVIGHAKAATPILPVPIEGPVYFVSHGGEAFPSLTMVLQGYGVRIDVTAATFINKAGITSSTFNAIPDQPVTSFEITLPAGPYSALAANGDLCAASLVMPTEFVGQNGAEIRQETPIAVAGCSTSLSFTSSIEKRRLTLSVHAPAAGNVTAGGSGLTAQTKTARAREDLTFKLTQKRAGKLQTTVKVSFTPSAGKDRNKQFKTAKLTFKK